MINLLAITFILMSFSCSSQEKGRKPAILIVYLSRTNNTKAVAEMIQASVGGRLVALELKNPYPENYKAIVEQVVRENEAGFLPPLKTQIDNIQQYDIVFVGFPTWGMQLPPPMKSFLAQYDLAGKTVVPFNTHAGYGAGNAFSTVQKLCPGSRVLEGYSTKGGIERDGVLFVMEGEKRRQTRAEIDRWLKSLKLTGDIRSSMKTRKIKNIDGNLVTFCSQNT
jgi:flavodoxin